MTRAWQIKLLRSLKGESQAHMRARLQRELHERAEAGVKLNWIDQGRREVSWQAN